MKNRIVIIILLWLPLVSNALAKDVIKNYIHISKDQGISHNNVTTICDDMYGRIWIGTVNGLDIYDSNELKKVDRYSGVKITSLCNLDSVIAIGTYNFLEVCDNSTNIYSRVKFEGEDLKAADVILKQDNHVIILAQEALYRYEKDEIAQIKQYVPYKTLCRDKYGAFWGLMDDKVYKINDNFDIVKTYKLGYPFQSPVQGSCLYADSKGILWVGTVNDGIYRYNRVKDEFYKEDLPELYGVEKLKDIMSIREDSFDRLWIGSDSGIAVYDYGNNSYKNYVFENSDGLQLNVSVTDLYKTKEDKIVVGSYFAGCFYIQELNSAMNFCSLTNFEDKKIGITANGIIRKNESNLLVATNLGGIYYLNERGEITNQLSSKNTIISDNIIPIEIDGKKNVWAGALSDGLYKIDRNDNVTHYTYQLENKSGISSNRILNLYSLNEDSLMIVSHSGVDIFHHKTGSFSNILGLKKSSNYYTFYDLIPYKEKIYLVNFNSLFCFNRSTKKIVEYNFDGELNLDIQCGYINKEGKIWLFTKQGDIFLFQDGALIPYIESSMIDIIADVQGDDDGNIWLTSGNNLFCISADKEVRKYNLSWGMGKNEFNVRSSYTDENGFIYFGYSNGVLKFHPKEMNTQELKTPSLYISEMKIFNEKIEVTESSILSKHINNTDYLELDNDENFISFEVASIDYDKNRAMPYDCMYMLENFDDNWYKMNTNSNEITFTGLSAGNYNLHIKLVSANGDVLDARNIAIKVKYSNWLRWYMILIYILMLSLFIYVVRHFIKKQRTAKAMIARTKKEKQELSSLNAMKLDFFTYISHEFKIPLSIIQTLQEEILPEDVEADSNSVIFKRNVKRLSFLIDQLMSFRNIESQHTSVQLVKYDIIRFLEDIYEAFTPLFKQKNISHQFISTTDSLPVIFDLDKMEILISNLLSNVFKHTEQGGEAFVEVKNEDTFIRVDIFNSGICLTNEQIIAIFQPYNKTNISGSYINGGIGLAIVSSLAKLLNIDLTVVPVENKGNIFRLDIPKIENHDVEISTSRTTRNIAAQLIDNDIFVEYQSSSSDIEHVEDVFQILLVEDHADSRKIFKKRLQRDFNVLAASSGREALLIMKAQNVDIVICDISIPEIDGYELCHKIKENAKTKHIPVILITADSSAEVKINAFKSGADAFLLKPINFQELLLRINNMLKSKNTLRNYYADFSQLNVESRNINNSDEIFLRELTDYIHSNIGNNELSVQDIAEKMNISRTQLYLNIKRLASVTPSEFILSIKMERAKHLLSTTDLTSSEISYELGYCNPHHFSRQFKNYVNLSPSDFRKQNIM